MSKAEAPQIRRGALYAPAGPAQPPSRLFVTYHTDALSQFSADAPPPGSHAPDRRTEAIRFVKPMRNLTLTVVIDIRDQRLPKGQGSDLRALFPMIDPTFTPAISERARTSDRHGAILFVADCRQVFALLPHNVKVIEQAFDADLALTLVRIVFEGKRVTDADALIASTDFQTFLSSPHTRAFLED